MASKPAATTDSGTNDPEPSNTNDAGNPSTAPTGPSDHISQEDLPFLVTHYLANFHKEQHKEESKASSLDSEQNEALDRIRRATNEIASAFSTLGAYGTSYRPSFCMSFARQSLPQNATFSDKRRQWSTISPSHLQNLVGAVVASNITAYSAAQSTIPANLLEAASEALGRKQPAGGRTLQDAIVLDTYSNDAKEDATTRATASVLQAPVLLSVNCPKETNGGGGKIGDVDVSYAEHVSPLPVVRMQSSFLEIAEKSAHGMRQFLELRETTRSEEKEILSLQVSLTKQEETLQRLTAERTKLSAAGMDPAAKIQREDDIKEGAQNCSRVIATLRRKLTELSSSHRSHERELAQVEQEAKLWFQKGKMVGQNYRDPFKSQNSLLSNGSRVGNNPLLRGILSRQHGIPNRTRNLPIRAITNDHTRSTELSKARKTVFYTRLSHAATINAHLHFPVYCLRFDRTGRYFITGADDYLIKVFYLGAAQSSKIKNTVDGSRDLKCNHGANARGAVLVCSLRGHAGVINDIDVSSDNCFLATASVDGDVRIWGLKDGCPIAILRGHKGGANMVSWSTLTPYRLVTTGSDGFARMWDVREATLKRYGAIVGKRAEYRLRLTEKEKKADEEQVESQHPARAASGPADLLPPLPVRGNEPAAPPQAAVAAENVDPPALVVPPLPDAVPPLPGAEPAHPNAALANALNEDIAPGQFVANDIIDEGVKLLAKYQHGATGPNIAGPGTRARRNAVNVICVARCPYGGHFTTGSDDGICRVWEDSDENGVEIIDQRFAGVSNDLSASTMGRRVTRSARSDAPLLKLMGHVSAITDLAYSHAGDRILSASQKDGVVRVWSLGMNFGSLATHGGIDERGVSQIVIKLTNPASSSKPKLARRRRPGSADRTEATKVSCDVAVWTHDDSRIITSQSVLLKQSGTEIQPGSQFIFLWESRTGLCLLGISGAHAMQCPVIIPHPDDASIVCSAGADGKAKVWDWETGRCIFSHENKIEYGPTDPDDNSKISGYLDGAFSADGTGLVLTDDNGRITILDSLVPSGGGDDRSAPLWMREQYFGNDYYELFYDTNGYCIERGSEQPPHVAPRGVRANHSGSAYPDEINEAFRRMSGPMPLPEQTCGWRRERMRAKGRFAGRVRESLVKARGAKVRRGVREFDPLTTIIIRADGHVQETDRQVASRAQHEIEVAASATAGERNHGNRPSSRALSSNYRYMDYEDLVRREGEIDLDEMDSDDEEFEPVARTARTATRLDTRLDSSDEDDDLDPDEMEGESPFRPTIRRRNEVSGERRELRAQRRTQRRDDQFIELGSDDEMIAQFMSTNNAPSGDYIRDYNITGHFWRLTGSGQVRRKWLSRHESETSYDGRKPYCPQLGDSIVYIPRAHFETINEFPSFTPPWQRWPQGTVWPVVRCSIRGIRYRFPYEDYFRGGQTTCNSIVAILTLEVTGIPELSEDREFPWLKPSFIGPTRSHLFEVSVFETDKCEFIIPEELYTRRLQALENALRARGSVFEGLEAFVFYQSETRTEDDENQLFEGKIEGSEEDDTHPDAHLRGSGFEVVKVNSQDYSDHFSPWEIVVEDVKAGRPGLSDEDKKSIIEALNVQLRKPGVREHLSQPVDEVRYSDYARMVEVPIDMMFIKRRLESDYYATKLSVAADVKLIRDNCVKYNGSANDLSRLACVMYDEFEREILSDEDRSHIVSEEGFVAAADEGAGQVQQAQHVPNLRLRVRQPTNAAGNAGQSTYGLRDRSRTRQQSSLETLSSPPVARGGRRALRNDFEASTNQRRSTRVTDAARDTEVLGRVSRTRGRLRSDSHTQGNSSSLPVRSARHSRGEGEEARPVSRALRNQRNATVNNDSENDVEESEDEVLPSRRSERSSRRSTLEVVHSEVESPTIPSRATARAASHDVGPTRATRGRAASQPPASQRSSRAVAPRSSRRQSNFEAENSSSEDEEKEIEQSDEDDDLELDSEEEDDDGRDRKRTRQPSTTRARHTTTTRSGRAVTSVAAREPESSTRRSHRSPEKNAVSYAEAPSEDEPEEFEEEEESVKEESEKEESEQEESEKEESEQEEPPAKRRSRAANSYAELPSDFEEEEEDEDDEDDYPNRKRKAARATPKRQRAPSNSRSSPKRKKTEPELPKVKEWPDIDLKSITSVSLAILKKVDLLDTDNIFSIPVLESYPQLADDYLRIVQMPMDLATIEEERLVAYESIRELQKDIVLIFRNCCSFNVTSSQYWNYAKTIWEQLDDLFREACEEENVLLPRRY